MRNSIPIPGTLLPAAAVLITLLMTVSPKTSSAQIDSTGFIDQREISARAFAMAGATLADYYDVNGMALNPAMLIFNANPKTIILSGQQTWNNNLASESMELPIYNSGYHALGFGMYMVNDGIDRLNYLESSVQQELDLNRLQFSVAYAIAITSKLSGGVKGDIIHGWNAFQKTWAGNFDFGLLYVPTKSISYAATIRNVGSDIRFQKDFDGTTLLRDRASSESIELGATMFFPDQTDRSLFTISLSNEKILGDDGLIYKGGIEITPFRALAIRGGYIKDPEQDGIRLGIGLRTNPIRFDYSLGPNTNNDFGAHHVAISINL